jgi:hypothetical protein
MTTKEIKSYVSSFILNFIIVYFGFIENIEWVQTAGLIFVSIMLLMIVGGLIMYNNNPYTFKDSGGIRITWRKIVYSIIVISVYGGVGAWALFIVQTISIILSYRFTYLINKIN